MRLDTKIKGRSHGLKRKVNLGVHNRVDIVDLMACPFETLGLDSGFRRRDEFDVSSLFVIPAKAGIQWYKRRV